MRSRFRLILTAALFALIAVLFALPIVRGARCQKAGGTFDRATLSCRLSPAPAAPASPRG